MRQTHLHLLLTFFLFGTVSCGGSSGGSDDDETTNAPTEAENSSIVFDSELSASERVALAASTEALESYVVEGGRIRNFSRIFGGNRSANVLRYFDNRVHYAFSASTDIAARLRKSAGTPSLREEATILASNWSLYLWYEKLLHHPDALALEVNGQLREIPSSRVGVMQFGEKFATLVKLQQTTTLVHEARHSDCPAGTSRAEVDGISNGRAATTSCGHLHSICPVGHLYEGYAACDTLKWGAYAVGAVYAGALALTCSTCSESERAIAEVIGLDSISRLQYSFESLMDGNYGSPQMGNSTRVR